MTAEQRKILDELNRLKGQLDDRAAKCKDFEKAKRGLKKAQNYGQHHLSDFDEREKIKYIESVVSEPPKKPAKWVIGKTKKYEEAVQKYNETIREAEKKYEIEYSETRKDLEEKDKKEYNERLNSATEKFKKSKEALEKIEKEISENEFLGPDLKEISAVNKLYSYVINNRVETIKEAIQLYFEEKRIEEAQKKDEEFRAQVLQIIDYSADRITQTFSEKFDGMTYDVISKIDTSVRTINDSINYIYWRIGT